LKVCGIEDQMSFAVWFKYVLATLTNTAGFCLNKQFRLNYGTRRMITMHRYFDISAVKRESQVRARQNV
jgi:hypothetical protein